MHHSEFLKSQFLTRELFEKYEWRKMEENLIHLYLPVYILLHICKNQW